MSKKSNLVAPARRPNLVVQAIGDEVLVFVPATHQAHALNRPAAAVFDQLDGKRTVAQVARHVAPDLPPAQAEAVVGLAIVRLAQAGLVDAPVDAGRRRALRRLAAATVLPAVASVLVPRPAAAATCVPLGSPCTNSTQCCPHPTIPTSPTVDCLPSDCFSGPLVCGPAC